MRRGRIPMLADAGDPGGGVRTPWPRCCLSLFSGILGYPTKSLFVSSSRGTGMASQNQAFPVARPEGRLGLTSAAVELWKVVARFVVVTVRRSMRRYDCCGKLSRGGLLTAPGWVASKNESCMMRTDHDQLVFATSITLGAFGELPGLNT